MRPAVRTALTGLIYIDLALGIALVLLLNLVGNTDEDTTINPTSTNLVPTITVATADTITSSRIATTGAIRTIPTITTTTITKTTTTKTAPKGINCVCVVDMKYITGAKTDKEKSLILKAMDSLFKERQNSTAGIWAYGTVLWTSDFTNVFDNMCDTYKKFENEANTAMKTGWLLDNELGENFTAINSAVGPEGRADSLLFVWGDDHVQKNWIITPSYKYTNIVVVTLQGADFKGHVDNRGKIIDVDLDHYIDEDVQKIVGALLS